MALHKMLCYGFILIFFSLFVRIEVQGREIQAKQATKSNDQKSISLNMNHESFPRLNRSPRSKSHFDNIFYQTDEDTFGAQAINYSNDDPKSVSYYGFTANMIVYGVPNLQNRQQSSAYIGIFMYPSDGPPDPAKDLQNFIHAGWLVNPALYGDSRTRFFTFWGGNGTECPDLICKGFVLVDHPSHTPGEVLDQVYDITIKIFKDKQTGDWWLHYGHGSETSPIGYFPKSLFSYSEKSIDIQFGGNVVFAKNQTSPPMGNGHFPSDAVPAAAAFKGVQYINEDGKNFPIGKIAQVNDYPKCYGVGDFDTDHFLYGGPGNCAP